MGFNDEQLPNKDSMHLMQCAYANKVSTLKNEELNNESTTDTVLNAISDTIDWEGNTRLLNMLCSTSPNRCMKNYIRGLMSLNEKDKQDINSFYDDSIARRNPELVSNFPTSFNSGLREYFRNETKLLDNLVQLVRNENTENTKNILFNIIRRRLDALDTLASFMSNGIFG